nr:reverse transcriptase domain-containing protein [Tanacetum cinerariifolium]
MFIRISGRSIPRTLKKCIKKSDFRWTTEAEQAFQQLKQHLSALPLLAAPKPQEEQIMYLFATHGAISAVLLTERGTVQTPVYFISRALQGPELNYSPMEKLVLSLVFAAKRLRRYFQAHPIAKFVPGHKCPRNGNQVYVIEMGDDDDEETEEIGAETEKKEHHISIHTLTGLPSYSTMRVQGSVQLDHPWYELTQTYSEVFQTPKGLPPTRPFDPGEMDQSKQDATWEFLDELQLRFPDF